MDVIPTWPNGKRWKFISDGYEAAKKNWDGSICGLNQTQEPTTSSSTPIMFRTPERRAPSNAPSTSSLSVPSNVSVIDPEICQICKVKHLSPEDIESDSHWVNCQKENGCDYWVHTLCNNIYFPNNVEGEKELDKWAPKHFFCRKHQPKAQKVGWDPVQKKDVVVGEKGLSKKILKLKKKQKK